jgi:hypothetical protein
VNTPTTDSPPEGSWYEIRLRGRLEARWSAWFEGMTLTTGHGTTTLTGPVVDQAALHGLLQQLRDLGLPLISVTPVEPDRTTTPARRRHHPAQESNTTAHPTQRP